MKKYIIPNKSYAQQNAITVTHDFFRGSTMGNNNKSMNRVQIRPITLGDTQLIIKWRNNPKVQRQFVYQKDFTVESHNEWMKTKVASGETVQFIIELSDSNTPIGTEYLRDIDSVNHSAEFGIFIGEDGEAGKGYGTEAAKLLIEYGFNVLGLHRIFLRVFSDNMPAINSYKKVGFTEEGTARDMVFQNGKYRSMEFMSIVRER